MAEMLSSSLSSLSALVSACLLAAARSADFLLERRAFGGGVAAQDVAGGAGHLGPVILAVVVAALLDGAAYGHRHRMRFQVAGGLHAHVLELAGELGAEPEPAGMGDVDLEFGGECAG